MSQPLLVILYIYRPLSWTGSGISIALTFRCMTVCPYSFKAVGPLGILGVYIGISFSWDFSAASM